MAQRQPFDVGYVLGRTFPAFFRNFIPFMVLSILVHFPLIAYKMLVVPDQRDAGAVLRFAVISGLGGYLLGLISSGALIYGVLQQLRGTPASIADCIRVGFTRLLPVLGVSMLVTLCVIPGLLLLIVPGIIIACTLWVAVPVTIIEKPGLIESLRRSADLCRGNRWAIFAIQLVLQMIGMAAVFIVGIVFGLRGQTQLGTLVISLVSIAGGALGATGVAVGYHDLRVAKEGVGIEDLILVFA